MDVTLTKKQEQALDKFIDAMVGEEPSRLDHGTGATQRRYKRREAKDWLYRFAALSMRVGAERARASLGLPHDEQALAIWKDPRSGAETIQRPVPDGQDRVTFASKKGKAH